MPPPKAKVFADDISLQYSSTSPYITYNSNKIIDTSGNNNGHLDPGETVDLIICLKNWGVQATGVEGKILCNDSFVVVYDSLADFGNIASGDTAVNTTNPFSIGAVSNTPAGHKANFTLIATSSGGYGDTSHFSLFVGKYDYLVWDPTVDHVSGIIINSTLQSLGYNGIYSHILPVGELDKYYAIFVSCGIFANNYIIKNSSAEASALINFLNRGGRLYLEGGDVWYNDPLYNDGYDFGPLFGINATKDGSNDLTTIFGQSGTFTSGMNFIYSGDNSILRYKGILL